MSGKPGRKDILRRRLQRAVSGVAKQFCEIREREGLWILPWRLLGDLVSKAAVSAS